MSRDVVRNETLTTNSTRTDSSVSPRSQSTQNELGNAVEKMFLSNYIEKKEDSKGFPVYVNISDGYFNED